jgi:hypothetical protein
VSLCTCFINLDEGIKTTNEHGMVKAKMDMKVEKNIQDMSLTK